MGTKYLTLDEACDFVYSFKASTHDGEPRSFKEAMRREPEEQQRWLQAALGEIQALLENGMFELVELPAGAKAIGSRWVFKVKRNAEGSIERYKARLVAQGFSQRPGSDYHETFAPTPRWAALHAVLVLAAFEDLYLESVDISSAFLNGTLKETVYMRQPEGFEKKGAGWDQDRAQGALQTSRSRSHLFPPRCLYRTRPSSAHHSPLTAPVRLRPS